MGRGNMRRGKWLRVTNEVSGGSGVGSLELSRRAFISVSCIEPTTMISSVDNKSEERPETIKEQKKSEFVPVNKTFRKVQALLLAKEKAMKHWDQKDSTFSDKIRNIHVTEGNQQTKFIQGII
jgi:hypothetical protein